MKTKQEIADQIKTSIDYSSDLVLENPGEYREYSDTDLMNATLIFQEVLMAKIYDAHSKKTTPKQLLKLVGDAGKSLRQTIKLFTGIDMYDVAKNI